MEHKINCEQIPAVFFSDKNAAKHYFRQYGRLKRITFRPKFSSCSVDYATEVGVLNAFANAGEYEGEVFVVKRDEEVAGKLSKFKRRRSSKGSDNSPEKQAKRATKSVKTKKEPDPDWLDDPEVRAELQAMGGLEYVPLKKYDLRPEAMQVDPPIQKQKKPLKKSEKPAKLKRTWQTESPKTVKKKKISASPKQLELIKIIKQPAITLEDKFKVLDARDKLIRLITRKKERKKDAKSRPMVGECPDMCPEKERILRQMQHQVALYEQEFGGREMNPSLAVKQYSRSSADQESPLPHELRPVTVLQMTMAYLMHQIMSLGDTPNVNFAEWFHFLWDRTRGIRKDITQQELCSQGSVQLVEQCARFHIHCSARLVAEDPAVFDQKINTENLTKCLQTLKYMYHDLSVKGESCPNEAEFRAYIILLNLNDGNFMWEVQQLREEIQKSTEVQFALKVYSAIDKNNYVRFFKLVYSTTYLNACILMRYFVQVRTRALKTFLKSFSPRIPHTLFPLIELTKILAFEDVDSTVEFLETYGLIVNTEKTHVILDRNNFKLPEYPYQLERAINTVESKRAGSVGETICGSKLPLKDFEYHIPEESFDGKGYLKLDGYLKECDIKYGPGELEYPEVLELGEDEADRKAREEEEENLLYSPVVSDSDSNDVFKKPFKENSEPSKVGGDKGLPSLKEVSQPTFSTPVGIFSKAAENTVSNVEKPIVGSIFANIIPAKPPQTVPKGSIEGGNLLFGQKPITDVNIFGNVGTTSVESAESIFGGKASEVKMFGSLPQTSSVTSMPKSQTNQSTTTSVTFTSKPLQGIFQQGFQKQNTPSGAISTFVMPKQQDSKIERLKLEELQKQAKLKKEIEETQKKLELEKQKLLEHQQLLIQQKQEELARARREEEMQRQLRAERIKQREIIIKQQQEKERKNLEIKLKKLQEERLEREKQVKEAEVKDTIKRLMAEVLDKVEAQVRKEKLAEITLKIRNRLALRYARLWHNKTLRNKRKRKALDCSPCWIYSKSVTEHAAELSMNSQEITLKFIKRYRRGKPFEVNPLEEEEISKIDIHRLVHDTLVTRLYEFDTILSRHIYWKVTISLPDSKELSHGLNNMQCVLDKYIQWERRVNNTLFIEQKKVNLGHTVTYCIDKQQGITKSSNDSHGYVFIAKDFNKNLCNRIIESLRDYGVYVKIPIVILLQEYDGDKTDLQKLIDAEIVSDYIIIADNFSSSTLVNIVDESLVFLASKIEKAPGLEMDTLKSFLDKYLCNDVWKRVISFSKWNADYKNCLKDPNIVIDLYNECLTRLKEIILNKAYFEFARFPEVFKNFLASDIPTSLPCDYRYFPSYWTNPLYVTYLTDIIDSLYLPKFCEMWPKDSEFELELSISKYCTNAFKQPERPFYRSMSVILKNIDPNLNFDDIKDVNWVDIIEVLAADKVNEIDFSLNKTKFGNQSVFNQFTVVYDPKILNDHKISDWFYTSNPVIQSSIVNCQDHTNDNDRNNIPLINSLNIDYDIDKALSDLLYKGSNKEKAVKFEKDLKQLEYLFDDLSKSIELGKKISNKFESTLQTIIEEN